MTVDRTPACVRCGAARPTDEESGLCGPCLWGPLAEDMASARFVTLEEAVNTLRRSCPRSQTGQATNERKA